MVKPTAHQGYLGDKLVLDGKTVLKRHVRLSFLR